MKQIKLGSNMLKKLIYWLLMTIYFIKGLIKTLYFKKGKTYHGGVNKCHSVYMGNRTFYETQYGSGLGFEVYDQKPRKYPIWQIGLFKWK